MSRIEIKTLATATPEVQERLVYVEKNNGFIPNLIGVLANAPNALQAYQEVTKINASGSLTAAEIEVVQITAATLNQCKFCVAGHSKIAVLKQLFTEETLAAIRKLEDFARLESKLNALAHFTSALINQKGKVSEQELVDFFAAGYTQQQAIEVVLGVSLATLCNYTNNLAQTPINQELLAFAE